MYIFLNNDNWICVFLSHSGQLDSPCLYWLLLNSFTLPSPLLLLSNKLPAQKPFLQALLSQENKLRQLISQCFSILPCLPFHSSALILLHKGFQIHGWAMSKVFTKGGNQVTSSEGLGATSTGSSSPLISTRITTRSINVCNENHSRA